jgi:hypothetical protein
LELLRAPHELGIHALGALAQIVRERLLLAPPLLHPHEVGHVLDPVDDLREAARPVQH